MSTKEEKIAALRWAVQTAYEGLETERNLLQGYEARGRESLVETQKEIIEEQEDRLRILISTLPEEEREFTEDYDLDPPEDEEGSDEPTNDDEENEPEPEETENDDDSETENDEPEPEEPEEKPEEEEPEENAPDEPEEEVEEEENG